MTSVCMCVCVFVQCKWLGTNVCVWGRERHAWAVRWTLGKVLVFCGVVS